MGGNYCIINLTDPRVQEAASSDHLDDSGQHGSGGSGKRRRPPQAGANRCFDSSSHLCRETDKRQGGSCVFKDVLVDFPDVWLEAASMRPEPPFFCQQLYSEYFNGSTGSAYRSQLIPKLLAQAAKGLGAFK